jgi:hypothetical protein
MLVLVGVGAGILLLLVLGLGRVDWLVRWQRRCAWDANEAARYELFHTPSIARRWTLIKARLWGPSMWLTATPLSMGRFTSRESETEGKTVAGALLAAMARVGGARRSGANLVAAPVRARAALEEVSDAFKAFTPMGKVVGAVLGLISVTIRGRDDLRLSGHVLPSRERGPGLALTLARASGGLVDSVILWAATYEPQIGPRGESPETRDERLSRLAVAGAAWTHFQVLRYREVLTHKEYRETLGTDDWESYALLQVGVESSQAGDVETTRALYARAMDRDTQNLLAHFNLAAMECREPASQVRAWDHLDWIHHQLYKASWAEFQAPGLEPFHYQVSYKRALAALVAYKRIGDGDAKEATIARLADVWIDLTRAVYELEHALEELRPKPAGEEKRRGRRSARNRAQVERTILMSLLERLEGHLLLVWVSMRFQLRTWLAQSCDGVPPEVPPPGGVSHAQAALLTHIDDLWGTMVDATPALDPKLSGASPPAAPSGLAGRLRTMPELDVRREVEQLLRVEPADEAVLGFVIYCARLDSDARHIIACFYAGLVECANTHAAIVGDPSDSTVDQWRHQAFEQIEWSIESGLATWATEDPQLGVLQSDPRWASVAARAGRSCGLGGIDAIGPHHASTLEQRKVTSLAGLRDVTRNRKQRESLARTLHIGPHLVDRWDRLATLERFHFPPDHLNLLERVGLGSQSALDDALAKGGPAPVLEMLTEGSTDPARGVVAEGIIMRYQESRAAAFAHRRFRSAVRPAREPTRPAGVARNGATDAGRHVL